MKDQNYLGYWWLPDAPKTRIAGTLAFSPSDGATLELMGRFPDIDILSDRVLPMLVGRSATNELITLEACSLLYYEYRDDGLSRYRVEEVYVGFNAANADELLFDEIHVEYTYLNDWVGLSGLKHESFEPLRIVYDDPEDVVAELESATISISSGLHVSAGLQSSHLDAYSFVRIVCKEPKDLEAWESDFLVPIRNLLNLATSHANFVEDLKLIRKTENEIRPISAYYQQSFYRLEKATLDRSEMLFAFPDINDIFQDSIANWLKACRELQPVLELFARERVSPRLFLQLRFLTVVQALETYHRNRFDNLRIDSAEHKRVLKSFLEGVPDEHRWWVRESLGHSDEKRFQTRIEELIESHRVLIERTVRNCAAFATSIKHSRNYYTHYPTNLRPKAAKDDLLIFLTEACSLLLEACLIQEIGLGDEEAEKLLRQSKRYGFLYTNRFMICHLLTGK